MDQVFSIYDWEFDAEYYTSVVNGTTWGVLKGIIFDLRGRRKSRTLANLLQLMKKAPDDCEVVLSILGVPEDLEILFCIFAEHTDRKVTFYPPRLRGSNTLSQITLERRPRDVESTTNAHQDPTRSE